MFDNRSRSKYNKSTTNKGQDHNSEISVMREEKMRLNNKLDEFSNILQTFQENQNKYMEENNQLK